jgi:hypothetical protein
MANYDIFDEQYYLSQYPWVKPAIDAGIIKSGREHFEKFGQAGGLTKISRYFDEDTYLDRNPELKPFVRTPNNPNAPFATGLDHFIQFGYEEGRTRVSAEYDEAFYVASNRDLQPFIQNGTFKNGYQHFIEFGIKDGRSPTSFLGGTFNRESVESGAFKTAREYYFKVGQFEPNSLATFVGTSGNDIVTGTGVGDVTLIGVEVGIVPYDDKFFNPNSGKRQYESDGSNEFDTLIGGVGRDTFVLAYTQSYKFFTITDQFYIGPGFATIRNFTQGQDKIIVGGANSITELEQYFPTIDEFSVFPINNNRDLAIQTNGLTIFGRGANSTRTISRFDTIAVIEGGGNLKLNPLPESGFSQLVLG